MKTFITNNGIILESNDSSLVIPENSFEITKRSDKKEIKQNVNQFRIENGKLIRKPTDEDKNALKNKLEESKKQ